MIKHIESGISGRGLNFHFLRALRGLAFKLHIKGVAFTKSDGSIKVIADGDEHNLKEFMKTIKSNNIFSSVENFYVNWHEQDMETGNFYVIN